MMSKSESSPQRSRLWHRVAWHRVARLGGVAATLACLAFVAARIAQSEAWTWRGLVTPRGFLLLALGGVAYAVICLSLAAAWRRLLHWLGESQVSFSSAVSIYGRSQLAKYLPGNVFHLAGRQYLAVRAGVSAPAAAAATLFEHTGLVAVACAVTLVTFPVALAGNPWLSATTALVLLAGMLTAPFVLPRFSSRFRLPAKSRGETLAAWLPVYGHYLFFMLAVGGLTFALAHGLVQVRLDGPGLLLVTAFAPAWIAGLVTPGAPSGIGVREAVLIFIMSPQIGESESTLAALALRLVTSLGDVLFFGLGHLAAELENQTAKEDMLSP